MSITYIVSIDTAGVMQAKFMQSMQSSSVHVLTHTTYCRACRIVLCTSSPFTASVVLFSMHQLIWCQVIKTQFGEMSSLYDKVVTQ